MSQCVTPSQVNATSPGSLAAEAPGRIATRCADAGAARRSAAESAPRVETRRRRALRRRDREVALPRTTVFSNLIETSRFARAALAALAKRARAIAPRARSFSMEPVSHARGSGVKCNSRRARRLRRASATRLDGRGESRYEARTAGDRATVRQAKRGPR